MTSQQSRGNVGESSGIEIPEFNINFQYAVLKLCLLEDYFCTNLVRNFDKIEEEISGDDSQLNPKSLLFDTIELHVIYKWISDSVAKYRVRPTLGQISQQIEGAKEKERESYFKALENIMATDVSNDKYYRDYLTAFIRHISLTAGLKKTLRCFRSSPNEAPGVMQVTLNRVNRISMEKEDVIHLNEWRALRDKELKAGGKIPSGLDRLDEVLRGGFPRQTLVTVLGASNAGKSTFCSSLCCSALRSNFKVLLLNFEGTDGEVIWRIQANLAAVAFENIEDNKLTIIEEVKLDEISEKYSANVWIRNMSAAIGGITIEEVAAYTREVYKDFKFDVIFVDYGQLLKTKVRLDPFERQVEVFRSLNAMSHEFNCVVISPVQSNREGIKKQNEFQFSSRKGANNTMPVLRSQDLADCIEIAKVSAIILTINRTPEEETRGWYRLYLEKQRRGRKGVTLGVKARYDQSNLIINDYYDPGTALVGSETSSDDDLSIGDTRALLQRRKSIPNFSDVTKTDNEDETRWNELAVKYAEVQHQLAGLMDAAEKTTDEVLLDGLMGKMATLRGDRGKLRTEAKLYQPKVSPDATKELYDLMKRSLDDLRKHSPETPATDFLKQELIVRRLEMVFGSTGTKTQGLQAA